MSNQIVRVAIGGQGRSGYNIHARHVREHPDQYRIVAVADRIAERRNDAAQEFGARAYENWEGMIRDGCFDLFVNALPTPYHVPGTIAALNAGHHVLCEKPMAGTVADFDRMVEAAENNNRVLAPFQNNRFQPFFEKIQDIIVSGVLGKIVYIRSIWGSFSRRWDWQTWQENMGGGLFNTGPHAIDQALVLFGWEHTPEVFCRMDCRNPFGADADDHCTVTLYDPARNAPQIDMVISGYMAYPQGDLYNICGTYGGLTGDANTLKWRYFDPDKAPEQTMWQWSVDRKYPREELDWIEETWTLESAKDRDAVGYTLKSLPSGPERIYNNIYDVLTGDGALLITPAHIRKQIAVMETCHAQNSLPRKNVAVLKGTR